MSQMQLKRIAILHEPQRFKYNITEVNPMLWSQFKDVSGPVNIPPYKAKLITQKSVCMKQYPLSPEKVEDIQPEIDTKIKKKQGYCPHLLTLQYTNQSHQKS